MRLQSGLEDGDVVRQDFWNIPDCPQFAAARLIPEPAVSAPRCRRPNKQEHNVVTKWTKDGKYSWGEPPYTKEEEAELEATTAATAIGSSAAGNSTPASRAAKRPRNPLVVMIA
jgi:hypothetical protein